MATKKKTKEVANTEWPQVNKGNHLTVYTFEDGSTKLEWDDEALIKEVQDAILSVSVAEPAKPKTTRKSKKV